MAFDLARLGEFERAADASRIDRILGGKDNGHENANRRREPGSLSNDGPNLDAPGYTARESDISGEYGAVRRLKEIIEGEWVPRLVVCLGIGENDMPATLGRRFLRPPDESGADTYAQCEFNFSSVFAISAPAATETARCVLRRLDKEGSTLHVQNSIAESLHVNCPF